MDGHKTVTAVFWEEDYWIDISAFGWGSVFIERESWPYQYGDEVTITAVAHTDWEFVEWLGDLADHENPAIVTVTGDSAATAGFAGPVVTHLC